LFSCAEEFENNPAKKLSIYTGEYRELMRAARKQNIDEMRKIVDTYHLNLNYADPKEGVSLLNWCILNNKVKAFEELLLLGADANWQDYFGKMAPAITEAAKLNTPDFLKLCLKYKANPNLLSPKWESLEDQTPLFGSIYPLDNIENLEILIQAGADVNLSKDSNSSSPLAQAIIQGRMVKAIYLINHGADYNNMKFWTLIPVHNKNGEDIIDSRGSLIMKCDERLNILDLLRDLTFPLNSKEYQIKMEIVDFLKEKGLDYWRYPIPDRIKSQYKNDPAYLDKY
jgi:ankyrin repeat protein